MGAGLRGRGVGAAASSTWEGVSGVLGPLRWSMASGLQDRKRGRCAVSRLWMCSRPVQLQQEADPGRRPREAVLQNQASSPLPPSLAGGHSLAQRAGCVRPARGARTSGTGRGLGKGRHPAGRPHTGDCAAAVHSPGPHGKLARAVTQKVPAEMRKQMWAVVSDKRGCSVGPGGWKTRQPSVGTPRSASA